MFRSRRRWRSRPIRRVTAPDVPRPIKCREASPTHCRDLDRIMDSFLNACGISEPLQLAVRGPSTNESGVRLLHQPFALIGRDQRADVPLDHRLVSRRHVYLQVVEGQASGSIWTAARGRSATGSSGSSAGSRPARSIRVGPFELQQLPWRWFEPRKTKSRAGAEDLPAGRPVARHRAAARGRAGVPQRALTSASGR